jgi:large subunit ribosomal protein L6e
MAPKQESSKAEVEHKTKKFGKAERKVPHHTQKAKKFYPAEDEAKPKKVRRG